jgi:hypothetical protein
MIAINHSHNPPPSPQTGFDDVAADPAKASVTASRRTTDHDHDHDHHQRSLPENRNRNHNDNGNGYRSLVGVSKGAFNISIHINPTKSGHVCGIWDWKVFSVRCHCRSMKYQV